MAQHHLDELQHALVQKGWHIIAARQVHDFPYDHAAWTIQRGNVTLEIAFDRFGGMGEDLPLVKSYGCFVVGVKAAGPSFNKRQRWDVELPAFISKLDDLEASLKQCD